MWKIFFSMLLLVTLEEGLKKKQFFKLFKVSEELTVQDYWRINGKSILENKIAALPARVLWPEKLRTE